MFRSIRWRLLTSYILLTLITVCMVGLIALWVIRRYANAQEVIYYTANAEAVARLAERYLQREASQTKLSQLVKVSSFLGNVRVRILDNEHNVFVDSGMPDETDEFMWLLPSSQWNEPTSEEATIGLILGLPLGSSRTTPTLTLPFIEELPPGTTSIIIRRMYGAWGSRFAFSEVFDLKNGQNLPTLPTTTQTERSHTTITVPIGEASNPLGYVELSAGADFSNEALKTARYALLIAGTVSILLAGAIGLWMGHRLTTPITTLSRTTARMSAGDLSVRASITGKDEIGELARQFNHMAEQLQYTFSQLANERDTLRRFIADASHELRTPITALRNFIEVLQSSAADDPQVRNEFLDESQIQLDRLVWITNNLLDLSRLDARLITLEFAEHDLRKLIEDAIRGFKDELEEKQIALLVETTPSPLILHCDRHRMMMCLINLMDNALRFTPQGGFIEIGARQEPTKTVIWVRDSGSGIPQDDLPYIFERFYRGKNATAQGSGLGLDIAKAIVKAHDGEISAQNHPDGGAQFTITLPTFSHPFTEQPR